MEGNNDEDDDLKLVKASAGLLADLENHLPKVLWKLSKSGQPRRPHTQVKNRDLGRLVSLLDCFQGEPQLLDAKLKILLPPIVEAYLQYLLQEGIKRQTEHVDLETAVCVLLYTLCKVRGYKIVTGFLNNEPRYLEPILEALENTFSGRDTQQLRWQVPYTLLLWLSHLLLTPFDLSSISTKAGPSEPEIKGPPGLPPLTQRILRVGLYFLDSPTKAQDAAAAMIVRLLKRPDVQTLSLADTLVQERLPRLEETTSEMRSIYEMLGSLRLIAGISFSAELSHLIPRIYQTCEKSFDEQNNSAVASNAVAKKIVVKVFRNIAILSLRSVSTGGPLLDFLQSSGVIENVIDYLLRSLADRDTPVRFAAAKAISLIVLELEPEMGHEVIQAVLDSFKEDIPRSAKVDYTTVNALKWHGLTLALAQTLFKRSASPEQLPDILEALISALQLQQRTATGSTLGTNVRDAANFGIWSLARRYTTTELLPVQIKALRPSNQTGGDVSIIQVLAIQLILSACLDPAGNIRRGSSAALQELVGRHPDQVLHGIALVQIVEYQAVSLRQRAMIQVANKAAALDPIYCQALFDGVFAWRGLGSADVPSRESAAQSIARLAPLLPQTRGLEVLQTINERVQACEPRDFEDLHGLALTAALVIESQPQPSKDLSILKALHPILQDYSPSLLRSELPAALAKYMTAICRAAHRVSSHRIANADLDPVVESLLGRQQEWIMATVPDLVQSVFRLKRKLSMPLTCVEAQTLAQQVRIDGSRSNQHGAGRAIALGTLATHYDTSGLKGENAAAAMTTLSGLMNAENVDWRIIGAKALRLVADDLDEDNVDSHIAETLCTAVHRGLNDFTIDVRGDVGSLVRLQSINCASGILSKLGRDKFPDLVDLLRGDIYRLSLEKLDKVRLAAAQLRAREMIFEAPVDDVSSVSSTEYFIAALRPLALELAPDIDKALLEGIISSAGSSAESLLQASRCALIATLSSLPPTRLEELMTLYTSILKSLITNPTNPSITPGFSLLAFLLDAQLLRPLPPTFKWRNLLSVVQKSHHKSNDIPKILAAVHVYIGLAEVSSTREEILKKLLGMLKTNPYPRVRSEVVAALWVVTGEEDLKTVGGDRGKEKEVADGMSKKYVQ